METLDTKPSFYSKYETMYNYWKITYDIYDNKSETNSYEMSLSLFQHTIFLRTKVS